MPGRTPAAHHLHIGHGAIIGREELHHAHLTSGHVSVLDILIPQTAPPVEPPSASIDSVWGRRYDTNTISCEQEQGSMTTIEQSHDVATRLGRLEGEVNGIKGRIDDIHRLLMVLITVAGAGLLSGVVGVILQLVK